ILGRFARKSRPKPSLPLWRLTKPTPKHPKAPPESPQPTASCSDRATGRAGRREMIHRRGHRAAGAVFDLAAGAGDDLPGLFRVQEKGVEAVAAALARQFD